MKKSSIQINIDSLLWILSLTQLFNILFVKWFESGFATQINTSSLNSRAWLSQSDFTSSTTFWLIVVASLMLFLLRTLPVLTTNQDSLPIPPTVQKTLNTIINHPKFTYHRTDLASLFIAVALLFLSAGIGLTYQSSVLGFGVFLAIFSACSTSALIGYKLSNREATTSIPSAPTSIPQTNSNYQARLYVHEGWMEGAYPILHKFPYTIGRNDENDLVLFDDIIVSRFHAEILYANDTYFLRSKKTNRPIPIGQSLDTLHEKISCPLQPNDYFMIGESVIQFVLEKRD